MIESVASPDEVEDIVRCCDDEALPVGKDRGDEEEEEGL